MLASTISIGVLTALDQRPSTAEIMSWIDTETLLLLFSMMVIVAILTETGIFDYLAVFAYKASKNRLYIKKFDQKFISGDGWKSLVIDQLSLPIHCNRVGNFG
jgi:di/tricarboxylate transporter